MDLLAGGIWLLLLLLVVVAGGLLWWNRKQLKRSRERWERFARGLGSVDDDASGGNAARGRREAWRKGRRR